MGREFGLQMAEFGTYPLWQQFRYRRGNEPFTTMTAAIRWEYTPKAFKASKKQWF